MSDTRLLGDRYELGEVLGRGGMAEVRRGRDRRLGRVVAIKMLRVDHAADATFQARFRREAQSAASLNHRSIVAVYDTGEDYLDGHRVPYIVMEYVEGRTLRELLRDRARFTPERSIEIISAVLEALEYSHRAGIVHRDIKPGNIMITGAGEVKVMDFGIARSVSDAGVTLTQTAAVVGTAQYISPEQARGEQADARSDLYATGCVLYELLTGRPPFVGESLVSVAVSHVREMPTPPSALDPSITRDLDAIVMKALAKDRLERYQSAHEMRADLERAAAGLPVAAAHDPSAATQLIAPATVAYDAYPTATAFDQVPAPVTEPERRGGMGWGRLALIALLILGAAAAIGYLLFRDTGGPQLVGVPNVVGQTEEQARATITGRDLTVGEVTPRETDNEEQLGTVLEQDPAPNERVEQGSTVDLVVGVASETVTVPDGLVGATEEEARQALEAAGLRVGDVDPRGTDEEDPGTVLETNPAEGAEVQRGSAVDLVVAAEPEQVRVPSVLGRSLDDARQAIEGAGLELGDVTRQSSDQPPDTVLATDPEGGTEVDPGTSVDVVIAQEPTQTPVPNVVGQRRQSAESALTNAGFDVSVTEQATCDVSADEVMAQSVPPGTEVAPGTEVQITVAVEPDGGCNGGNGGGGENGGENGSPNPG
ncbi:MAG: Stk1 family PASTA domain-containing Ser/Thr kinase [Jiangellaceae bacterium]|nr:Stk1 family PASTA domain-containing Ser/Thr kinase [Jiangellaceae bacterium]